LTDKKYISIHFTFEEWSVKQRKKDYLRIQKATEEGKEQIAKELALLNVFLLKRNFNIAFRNYIYSQIDNNEELQFFINKEFLKVLSNAAMKEKHIQNAIDINAIGLNMINFREMDEMTADKLAINRKSNIEFFRNQWEESLRDNKTVNAIIYESFYKEYARGTFLVGDLFVPSFPYDAILRPQKYEYITGAFLETELKNYKLYKNLNSPILAFTSSLFELSELFSKSLTEKVIKIVFEVLGVEKNIDTVLNYNKLIRDLLAIASRMYFDTLTFEEKKNLLNKEISLNDLVKSIELHSLKFKPYQWDRIFLALRFSGYLKIAIHLAQSFIDNRFEELEDSLKFGFLDTLATLYKHRGDHKSSLKYYKEAYKWIEKIIPYKTPIDPFNLKEIIKIHEDEAKTSMNYRKAIALKNIGEAFGHLNSIEQMENYFTQVTEIMSEVINEEKFWIYWNLSFASRRLGNFEKERDFLNSAIDINAIESKKHELYIDQRVNVFLETEMNKNKLLNSEYQENYNGFLSKGVLAQISFNFEESLEFFEKAFNLAEKINESKSKLKALKGLAFSYLYLNKWEDSKRTFERILSFLDDYESKTTLSLIYYNLNEKERSLELIKEICTLFVIKTNDIRDIFQGWVINSINYIGAEKMKDIFLNLDLPELHEFLIDLGILIANMGFFSMSIDILLKSFNLASDNNFKANCAINIGTIYSNQDKHQDAIKYYDISIKLDKNNPISYQDRAASYAYLLNFLVAKRDINKAINIANKRRFPLEYVEKLKGEREKYILHSETLINIHSITHKDAIDTIITSERLFKDYKGKDTLLDASTILKGYAKGLEMILDDRFYSTMKALAEERWKNRRIPTADLRFKFGFLFAKKKSTFVLGKWERTLIDFEDENVHPDLLFFKKNLKKLIKPKGFEVIQQACAFLTPLCNPTSHSKNLTYEEVIAERNKAVLHLNKVIDILL